MDSIWLYQKSKKNW